MRPISKQQKELQGTNEPSRDSIDPVELEAWDGERMPPAPDGWPPPIQRIWNERCKDLFKSGYLAKAFLPGLKRYCFAIMQAETAEAKLLEEGFVTTETGTKGQEYEVVSKWVMVLDNANKAIDRIGSKFGFTPLDVQKIPVIQKKVEVESLLK